MVRFLEVLLVVCVLVLLEHPVPADAHWLAEAVVVALDWHHQVLHH